MTQAFRQTGRTEKLVVQAIDYSMRGRAVYVLVHDKDFVEPMKSRLRHQIGKLNLDTQRMLGIKVEVLPEDFDWGNMRPAHSQNVHPNCLWLVDHWAATCALPRIDKEILQRLAALEQLRNLRNFVQRMENP